MIRSNTDKLFTSKQTNIAKGIACILLLFHHLFYSTASQERFTSLLFFKGEPLETTLATVCRVCVAIFLFLSGYGVNETFNKRLASSVAPTKTLIRTSCRLLWKLWANYFVVFLLFVPWQGLFDRQPYTTVLDLITDVMGISFIINTPTMNATWWFMSVAIASYIFAPLIKAAMTKRATLLLALVPLFFLLFLMFGSVFWSYAFLCGMIASEFSLLNRLQKKMTQFNRLYVWGVCTALVLTTGLLRYLSPSWGDFPFAVAIVIFSFLCVSELRFLVMPLEFIGKHSANIFFFHSFLYLYNFKSIVYAPKYAPLILPIFVIECLAVSVVIEFLKKITGIQKGIQRIERAIEGNPR